MMLSPTQMMLMQETAHANMTNMFAQLGFKDIDCLSNEYVHQYNAEVTTLLMGRDICWSTEEDLSDKEGTGDHPYEVMSFQEQRA